MSDPKFNPGRLEFARTKVGYTNRLLSEKTGVAESTLSEYENGRREPRWSHICLIAEAFYREPEFFYEEGDPVEQIVRWRCRPADTVATETEAQFLELCQQFHALEMLNDEPKRQYLPILTRPFSTGLADEIREKLDLGRLPGPVLLSLMENEWFIKVFHLPLGRDNAISTVDRAFGPAVLLNADDGLWERTFSLAHELFHLLTWTHQGYGHQGIYSDEMAELAADEFARDLLLSPPVRAKLCERFVSTGHVASADVFEVCRQTLTPAWVVLWGILDRCSTKPPEQARASAKETAADWRDKRSEWARLEEEHQSDEVRPPDRPERFRALAAKAYRASKLSTSKMMSLLGISRAQVKELYEKEGGGEEMSLAEVKGG